MHSRVVAVFVAGFMESRPLEQHLGFSEDNDSNDLSAYVALDYAQNP